MYFSELVFLIFLSISMHIYKNILNTSVNVDELIMHLYIYKATDILFRSINIMLNLCVKSTGSWDAQILSQAKQEEISAK